MKKEVQIKRPKHQRGTGTSQTDMQKVSRCFPARCTAWQLGH